MELLASKLTSILKTMSRKPLAEANMKKVTNEETTYDQRRCYVTYCMFLPYETPLPLHTCSSPHVPRWRSL